MFGALCRVEFMFMISVDNKTNLSGIFETGSHKREHHNQFQLNL